MMLVLYNIIQILALLLLWPVGLVVVLSVPKYRSRFARRLGAGLANIQAPIKGRRVWVHALSVGECSSAKPLLEALKRRYPDIYIIFSTTTRGGEQFSASMAALIDLQIAFPVDLLFVVQKFIRYLRPDLFILVETDFWPNLLYQLNSHKVPSILVNGRITEESFRRYKKAGFLFRNIFNSFHTLFMQTDRDVDYMKGIGVESRKVKNIGNLKYDMMNFTAVDDSEGPLLREKLHIPVKSRVVIAGSTHPGEEKQILEVYKRVQQEFADLFLIIAPRDVSRGAELVAMLNHDGLVGWRKTGDVREEASVLILDTLGELTHAYSIAEVVFVGGSLVDEGGHNPLEASFYGKAVLFGPSMTDFSEIVRDLQVVQAGKTVNDTEELYRSMKQLLIDDSLRKSMGAQGAALVRKRQGAAHGAAKYIGQVIGL